MKLSKSYKSIYVYTYKICWVLKSYFSDCFGFHCVKIRKLLGLLDAEENRHNFDQNCIFKNFKIGQIYFLPLYFYFNTQFVKVW